MARCLVATRGADSVKVITGMPNYPFGKLLSPYRGRLFKRGIGKWGESILHLYEYPAPFDSVYRKTLGLFSFSFSLSFFMLFKRFKKDDIVIVTLGPIFQVISTYIMSLLKRNIRYIVDVRDLWPEMPAERGYLSRSGWSYKIMSFFMRRAYRKAECVIGNSDGICEYLKQHYHCRSVFTLNNPVDFELIHRVIDKNPQVIEQVKEREFGRKDVQVFLLAGVFANYLGIENLLKAFQQAFDENPDIRLLLIGKGEEEQAMRRFIRCNKLESKIRILDFIPREELLAYVVGVDVCVAILMDGLITRTTIPTKILDYLACGKTVIASIPGRFAETLNNVGVAHVVPPDDVGSLRDAIVKESHRDDRVLRDPKIMAFAEHEFSLERFNKRFLKIVDPVIGYTLNADT